jgi:hypothetical protein
VRWGNWKGTRLNVRNDRNGPIELYDLANDLAEEHNVASKHPDVLAQIAKFMDEAHVESELISFDGPQK